MKACELHIVFEQADKTFALGDTLRGRVVVDITKTTQCNGLDINLFWRTHGRGDTNTANEKSQNLFTGEWQPGHYEYPFKYELKENKTSYHGEIINLDWYLEATADVPWAFDPNVEEDFLLLSRPLAEDYHYRQRAQIEQRKRQKKSSSILQVIIPLLFFSTFAIFFFKDDESMLKLFSPISEYFDQEHGLFISTIGKILDNIIWLVPLIIGAVMLGFLFRYLSGKQVEKLLADLQVTLSKSEYHPGERIDATLSCTPQRDLTVENCYAQLIGQEVAVDNSGTTSTTHKHEIYFDEVPVSLPQNFNNQVPVSSEISFEVPDNIPASFSTGQNSIKWSLKLDLKLTRWLRWLNTTNIRIRQKI